MISFRFLFKWKRHGACNKAVISNPAPRGIASWYLEKTRSRLYIKQTSSEISLATCPKTFRSLSDSFLASESIGLSMKINSTEKSTSTEYTTYNFACSTNWIASSERKSNVTEENKHTIGECKWNPPLNFRRRMNGTTMLNGWISQTIICLVLKPERHNPVWPFSIKFAMNWKLPRIIWFWEQCAHPTFRNLWLIC